MNVKSRAQLIVWCLPHLGFVESESRAEAAQPAGATVFGATQATTVTQAASSNAPITLPGGGMGRTGNSDIGI